MNDSCCCPPEAGNAVCDLHTQDLQSVPRTINACPECGKTGKPVQRQTVSAMLSVSLREVQSQQYLFCRTQICPVVYFSVNGEETFIVEQVRERVYQKEPEAQDVMICCCFRHTVGDLHAASSEDRTAIVDNVPVIYGTHKVRVVWGMCTVWLSN